VAERAWLEAVVEALSAGRPAREVPVPEAAPDALRKLSPLTAKPVLYVVNVDEGETEAAPELLAHAEGMQAKVVVISARIEADLRELDPDEAEEMRGELGIERSGLQRLIRAAFELLDLISFFTADTDKDAMARTLPRGATAYEAAGRVHGDIQKAFVRAEVIGWDELVDAGGYAAARDRGTLRTEGRDYVVQDGDVIHIRT
jgi:ribosome-binding ATPase YchF (GTP1/OBG family)